jgi:hypothetical protein
MLFGDFSTVEELAATNQILGPVFFLAFIIIVSLVFMVRFSTEHLISKPIPEPVHCRRV